jgi:excisionase family DNA binding protein
MSEGAVAIPNAKREPEEVAKYLGVPLSWVYAASARGDLPSYKVGKYRRFDMREIDAWLSKQGGK